MDNLPIGAEFDTDAPFNEAKEEERTYYTSVIIDFPTTVLVNENCSEETSELIARIEANSLLKKILPKDWTINSLETIKD